MLLSDSVLRVGDVAGSARKEEHRGNRRQAQIVGRAVSIASIEGLSGLTIGRLAEELKMSKSGLFAHFRSKRRLELATLEQAQEIFANAVLLPAQESPDGIARLWALCDLWLEHIEERVFPGSYFFAGAFFEYGAQDGPVASQIREAVQQWPKSLKDAARMAQKNGEIDADADPEQVSLQLASLLVGTHWSRLLRDNDAFRKSRERIVKMLGELATKRIPKSAFESLSTWRKFLKQRDT